MEIVEILSALRRNKTGALLIGLQIAITVAIVGNALSLIEQRLQRMERATGIDEQDIFTLQSQWPNDTADLPARIRQDIAALRSTPGIAGVWATQSYPLRGGGAGTPVMLRADQKQPTAIAAMYFGDDQTLGVLGLRLVAGRWFQSQEIHNFLMSNFAGPAPAVAVVSEDLARSLYPGGSALGKYFYSMLGGPTQIVGIVARAQASWAASESQLSSESSLFVPNQWIDRTVSYVVRAQPGLRDPAMRAARDRLILVSRARIVGELRSFDETRAQAYRSDRALGLLLMVMCGLLLAVTGLGIVGLSMFWVTQRRRQIGIRRALGARRVDILRYFHTENLLITVGAASLGVVLGVAANLWLATLQQLTRIDPLLLCAGALVVVVISQVAILWPALRGVAVPPALAARGV